MASAYSSNSLQRQPLDSYRIRVQGYLSPAWSDRLGGLKISAVSQGGCSITTLSGPVIDQAALLGVLNALYDLQLKLLSVERLEANGSVILP